MSPINFYRKQEEARADDVADETHEADPRRRLIGGNYDSPDQSRTEMMAGTPMVSVAPGCPPPTVAIL